MTDGTGTLPAEARGDFGLWAGWMAGPVAWFMHMVAVYALADGACHGGGMVWLHLATAASLLFAAVGGRACRARWRGTRRDSADPREARERFMASQGMLCNSLFAAVILAQWITVIALDPCPL